MKDGKTSEAFAYIFYSVHHSCLASAHLSKVLQEMRQRKIPLDSNMLGELISRAIYNNNLELSLRYLYLLRSQNHSPIPTDSVQPIITLAARQNHSRLAIDIALWYDSVGEKLPKSVWTLCLASAATTLYTEGILVSWSKIHSFPDTTLTCGLLTVVLQATKRLKLPELSDEVERTLHTQTRETSSI